MYRLSRQSLVFGPQQIENRINQDTEISRQVSLWDQRGSEVIRGDLLVIPIEESLLYVQPLYLQAEGGPIPELKRVVVAYQNQVVMEETLDAALDAMFGGGQPAAVAGGAAGKSGAQQGGGQCRGRPRAAARRHCCSRRRSITIARWRRSGPATGRNTASRSTRWARRLTQLGSRQR